MSDSVWLPVAIAPSTSMAVELAALLPPNSPLDLPCTIDELHPRARANLLAVSRALERDLAGLSAHPRQQGLPRSQEFEVRLDEPPSSEDAPTGKHVGPSLIGSSGLHSAPTLLTEFGERSEAVGRTRNDTEAGRDAENPVTEAPRALSAEALAHIIALKQWAVTSSHVPAPTSSMSGIIDAVDASGWVSALFSDDLSVEAVSALIVSISPVCSARLADLLAARVVLPRISALAVPASRDFMKAVSTFVEYHWRAVLPVYDLVRKQSAAKPLGAPAAEVLVRVAAELGAQGAREALLICCEGTWREEGVRVIEALLVKSKTEPGVADPLVAGLDRNIQGLEGSLRFGKLLLTVVKDVPGLTASQTDALRGICFKSTAFLGKRALAMLDGGK